MFRIGAWNSGWTRENCPVAAPLGDGPNHPTVAATGPSSPDTRPRPTKVATSTSSQRDRPYQNPRATDHQRVPRMVFLPAITREQGGGPGKIRLWDHYLVASLPRRGLPRLPR